MRNMLEKHENMLENMRFKHENMKNMLENMRFMLANMKNMEVVEKVKSRYVEIFKYSLINQCRMA